MIKGSHFSKFASSVTYQAAFSDKTLRTDIKIYRLAAKESYKLWTKSRIQLLFEFKI